MLVLCQQQQLYVYSCCLVGGLAQWLGHRSLAGGLSLIFGPVWYPGLVEYIGATSFPDTSVVRGDYCVYCIRFSCLSLLSCAELCAFLCPLVLFTLVISFGSNGFPYKNQIEELFIVIVNCMSPNI